MSVTIFDSEFKTELAEVLKDISFTLVSVMYYPTTQSIIITTNKTGDIDKVLNIEVSLYQWYNVSMASLNEYIKIIKGVNITYTDINNVINKLVHRLTLSESCTVKMLKDMDTISNIIKKINDSEDTYVMVHLYSDLKGVTDKIKLESYVLYKNDVPYFKIYDEKETMLISCKVLLEKYSGMVITK